MSHGRTYWWAKDAGWWRREWIVDLGEEFGSHGPAVIDWLACEAKAQNDGGIVSAGVKTVARGCFVDVVTVCHVLSRSVTLGLLEEYDEHQGRFTCRISGWRSDQERNAARERKANSRARQSTDTGDHDPDVTVGHGWSHDVPESHLQDRTGQDIEDTAKAVSVLATPALSGLDLTVNQICDEFSAHVRTAHGIASSSREGRVVKGWRDACRSMLTIDGLSVEQIQYASAWVCRHHYWKNRVKSMTRLRSEMPQIAKDIREQKDGGSVVRLGNRKPSAGDLINKITGGDAA